MEFSKEATNLYLFLLNARPDMITTVVQMMCHKYTGYKAIQRRCFDLHELFQACCLGNFPTSETALPWEIPELIPMDQFFSKLHEALKKYGPSNFAEFNDYLEKTHHLLLLIEDQSLPEPQIKLSDLAEFLIWKKKAKSITL